jgi:hypothetical protein
MATTAPKKQKRITQGTRILNHLNAGRVLNRLDGWDLLGILETPARISELRKQGHPIQTNMITVTNRFGDPVSVAEWSI